MHKRMIPSTAEGLPTNKKGDDDDDHHHHGGDENK